MEHQLQAAQGLAAQAADRLIADFPDWQINTETWIDTAGPAIIRKAFSWKPDLIVLGSHGRSGISRLVLGSVSQHVLHHVTCSVRISRHRLHSQNRAIRVLVGVDGSDTSLLAVRSVAKRDWPRGTEVRVMAVIDRDSLSAIPPCTTEALPQSGEEKRQSFLSHKVHEAVHELQQCGLLATPQVLAGKPCDLLVAEAEKWAADCIFVAASSSNRFDRIVPGGISTAVASHAHCSVEIVRD